MARSSLATACNAADRSKARSNLSRQVATIITYQQALTLDTFHAAHHKDATRCAIYRRQGKTRTWKRRPTDYAIPTRFGLYRYVTITQEFAHMVYAPADCPICNNRDKDKAYEDALRRGEQADVDHAEAMKDYGGN